MSLPGLIPIAYLTVANPLAAYGTMDTPPEAVSWDLRGLISSGTGAGRFAGADLDPTGQYVMQARVPVFVDADETHWGSLTGTYTHGTDPSVPKADGTAAKFLKQSAPTGAFSATFGTAHGDNEGFVATFWRGATQAGTAAEFYLWLNAGAASGKIQYRVAFVPGLPVRLQQSGDGGATWDGGTPALLGDAEEYLKQQQRRSSVLVLPMCDPAWAAGLPDSLASSDKPPGTLAVVIGHSDFVFSVPAPAFAAGSLKITGQGGQWSVGVAKLRFAATLTAALGPQARPADLTASVPLMDFQGYVPPGATTNITVTNPTVNQGAAVLTVDASALVDDTGYATASVYLATIDLSYEPQGAAPLDNVAYVTYEAILARIVHTFYPDTGFVRTTGELLFSNRDLLMSPGLVRLGVRAAQVLMGYLDAETGLSVAGAGAVQIVLTGYTGLGEGGGLQWTIHDGKPYFRVQVDDKMRPGDEDQEVCGDQLPYDFQCHYHGVAQQLYRMGIQDQFLGFPLVGRNEATDYYYLPGNTAQEPLLQPAATEHLNGFIAKLRSYAGEPDPVSGQYAPMVIGPDALGVVQYYPLPPGLVQPILDRTDSAAIAALVPLTTFSRVETVDGGGNRMLNQLLSGGLTTSVDLTHIRNETVLIGFDPETGNLLVSWVKRADLAGGSDADPDAPGFVGGRRRFINISRLYNSPEAITVGLALANVLLNYPEVRVTLNEVALQAWMYPLMVFAVQDFATMGNVNPVPFFVEEVAKVVDRTTPEQHRGYSVIQGRLLGLMTE